MHGHRTVLFCFIILSLHLYAMERPVHSISTQKHTTIYLKDIPQTLSSSSTTLKHLLKDTHSPGADDDKITVPPVTEQHLVMLGESLNNSAWHSLPLHLKNNTYELTQCSKTGSYFRGSIKQ